MAARPAAPVIERLLGWLAAAALRGPRRVVAACGLLSLLALAGAWRLPDVLHPGPGSVQGGDSQRVERLLLEDFRFPYVFPALVAGSGPGWPGLADDLAGYLERQPGLATSAQRLPGYPAGALLVGLAGSRFEDAERRIPRLRGALRDWQAATPAAAGVALQVTGDAAFSHDMNALSARQGLRAEEQVLVLTLAILVLVFRSPIAALLPVATAACAMALALGALYVLGRQFELSVLVRNVVSMIGLGVGIDYALILVSRFRQELAVADLQTALDRAMRAAGRSVIVSALAVIAGLSGLLAIPLLITRSIGLGGVLVVAVTMALSLTLLPALLVLLAPYLGAPRPASPFWQRWARWVTGRPWTALLLGGALLLALGAQAARMRLEPPRLALMPAAMEARAAADRLAAGGFHPAPLLFIVVETADGRPLVTRESEARDWLDGLQRAHGAAATFDVPSWLPQHLAPLLGSLPAFGWSDDGARLLVVAHPRDEAAGEALAAALRQRAVPAGVRVSLGGLAALNAEFAEVLAARMPLVLAWVCLCTWAILAAGFRSVLLPTKALAVNALTVAAAFGCLVLTFQDGWGIRLLGLAEAPGSVLLTVPALLFCIVFGLSMDYEVFLLSRVREAHDQGRGDREAIAEGLASTGGLISGAALIMVTVFGAFTLADIILVKETGFGLGVAVLLDATVVRLLLVPAIMQLAGKWNWWPR